MSNFSRIAALTCALLVVASNAFAKADPCRNPANPKCLAGKITLMEAAVQALQQSLSNIQLTPGPKGDKGDQGIQGIQGIKGDTGASGDVTECPSGMTLVPRTATARSFCVDNAPGFTDVHGSNQYQCEFAGKAMCRGGDITRICGAISYSGYVWTQELVVYGTTTYAYQMSCSGGKFPVIINGSTPPSAPTLCCLY